MENQFDSRKQFIESQGGECRNWIWSWSFVNHPEKRVIFGAWNTHEIGGRQKILDEDWVTTAKRAKASGYDQSVEHARLIDEEGYALETFPIKYSDEYHDAQGIGPAKIESFKPILTKKNLIKDGTGWFAVDDEQKQRETARVAQDFNGDKLYQIRARKALPILVRQARAKKSVTYGDLAQELGMPNARNLNYVLGCIGQTLLNLSKRWEETIPPLQCLVLNQNSGLPGDGVGWFIEDMEKYRDMPKWKREGLVEEKLNEIYHYERWPDVLRFLELEPNFDAFIGKVKKPKFSDTGGGEGEPHKKLKEYVASNPQLFGLPRSKVVCETEFYLPSGDSVDVMFVYKNRYVGVEVKSFTSNDDDIRRGMFQCIKYQAVTEAMLLADSVIPSVQTVLVTGRELSGELIALRNTLQVNDFFIDKTDYGY